MFRITLPSGARPQNTAHLVRAAGFAEFGGDAAGVARLHDGFEDVRVVQLARARLMPPRIVAKMIMLLKGINPERVTLTTDNKSLDNFFFFLKKEKNM